MTPFFHTNFVDLENNYATIRPSVANELSVTMIQYAVCVISYRDQNISRCCLSAVAAIHGVWLGLIYRSQGEAETEEEAKLLPAFIPECFVDNIIRIDVRILFEVIRRSQNHSRMLSKP